MPGCDHEAIHFVMTTTSPIPVHDTPPSIYITKKLIFENLNLISHGISSLIIKVKNPEDMLLSAVDQSVPKALWKRKCKYWFSPDTIDLNANCMYNSLQTRRLRIYPSIGKSVIRYII